MLHVALYQPVIAPNIGNAARQCVGMRAKLHVIGPTHLSFDDTRVKRAGLDYWPHLAFQEHVTPEAFVDWLTKSDRQPWLVTKHGPQRYDRAAYTDEDVLIFGNEKTGLPESWHDRWPDRRICVPILGPVRSYNLSNTVAIVLAQASLTAGRYDTDGAT